MGIDCLLTEIGSSDDAYLVDLSFCSVDVAADEQAPSTVERQRPATENGDTTKRSRQLSGNIKTYAGNYGTGYGYTNMQMTAGAWTAGGGGGYETTDGYKLNNDKERWKVGGNLMYSIDEGKNASFSADYIDDQQEETYSLFAAETLSGMLGCLSLTAGLRANINSAFDDALNPEIKLTYKWKKWRATAAYSRSSNTPSFYQRYNETSSTRPNPDLTMETADNYSVSLFDQLHKTLSGSVSVFHNRLSDRITYVTGEDGIGQYHNHPGVYAHRSQGRVFLSALLPVYGNRKHFRQEIL